MVEQKVVIVLMLIVIIVVVGVELKLLVEQVEVLLVKEVSLENLEKHFRVEMDLQVVEVVDILVEVVDLETM